MAILVFVQVLAPEVIGDVEVGPAVAVVVAPGGRKTVAVVVFVEAHGGGDIFEESLAGGCEPVVKQEIRRAVARIASRPHKSAWRT